MIHRLLVFIAILSVSIELSAQTEEKEYPDFLKKIEESGDFAPMFPFQPTHDAPQNITNVEFWPGSDCNVAGGRGFMKSKGEDFVDALGQPKRFLGTNICFSGCFPKHEDADRVAEELARYGINIVRLHYVHHQFPKDKIYPAPDSFLEPEQLELFDYLFAKLKEKGIYTYFQLNISRKFGAHNGFENASRLPFYNHGIDNVDYRMIMLQQRYIYEILNHKNPYTGLQYKNEPAISMLELSNENSIINTWFQPRYRFDRLTEPYAGEIKAIWNTWLKDRYGNTENLRNAWLSGLEGDGTNYTPEGIFTSQDAPKWYLQNDKVSVAEFTVVPATPKDKIEGKYFLRLNVETLGATTNMPQFARTGLKFTKMSPMTLKFRIRADKAMTVKVRCSQGHAPWLVAGFSADVSCTPKWKEYKFPFAANMDDDNIRLLFSHFTKGVIDIADVSLVSGMEYEWPKEISVESGNVDWPYRSEWSMLPQRAYDFTEFIAGLESYYFSSMYVYAKGSAGARQPVTGTQLRWGLDHPQAKTDYADYHSYWNHPVFPGSAYHNVTNWNVETKALVNGDACPGTNLAGIARARIYGRPLTISEYDHPNINPYSAEGNLMASAMGAFQNWSGIIQFAWTHNQDFFRSEMNTMFDMCSATQKLVHLPACYAMFVRGDVSKGKTDTVFVKESSFEKDIRKIADVQAAPAINIESSSLLAYMPLAVVAGERIEEYPELFDKNGKTIIRTEDDVPQRLKNDFASKEVQSSTGELTWNWQQKGAGFLKVDTPNTKVFTGFVRGRSFEYEGMVLTPGKTRLDWLTMSMVLTDPEGKEDTQVGHIKPGTYLLALTGLCHNTDAVYVEIGGNRLSSCEINGGAKGKAPVLCEGIKADLKLSALAGRVECHALDGGGNRMEQVRVSSDAEGNAVVFVGPEYKTVWYELIIK